MDTKEESLLNAVAIASIILIVLVSLLAWAAVRFVRRKSVIEKQSLMAGIQIQEAERERIATDVHDELGSLISAIKIHLERSDVNAANQLIDSTMIKVREIASNLSPRTLQLCGLGYAVKEFATTMSLGKKFSIHFDPDPLGPPLGASLQLQVYRIAQEILHNIAKHAQASHVNISIQLEKQVLEMMIKDDGVGFDPQQIEKAKGGHGLENISTRVKILKGKLMVDARPGNGVFYKILIPVK